MTDSRMTWEDARAYAMDQDRDDPLRRFRDEFVIADPDLIYLDGNSLGRLPKRTAAIMQDVVNREWGSRLVRSWPEHWIDLPRRLGGKLAQLVGAGADEVVVCDSTSVNFYKLAMAGLAARPGRTQILTDNANFPSDVYLLQGCAQQTGHELVVVAPNEIESRLDERTALLALSHVAFKSGGIQPMERLTRLAHGVGSLTLWDLSHSVGVVPIDLSSSDVDLAVGCTYKYLNGGPGAPAFLFVRRALQAQLTNPVWGWFGQRNPFDFALDYHPADGLDRFLTGTPPILSMSAAEPGVDMILEAGIDRIREKSVRQTEFLIRMWETNLEPFGVTLNSPRDSRERGSHVSFGHPEAFRVDQALIQEMNVIPDFRRPDNIRFGVTPLYTTYLELLEAVLRMRQVLEDKLFERYPSHVDGVT